eukprot:CAMPEP_0194748324 /NCGR_PEP_ID=MMETSP0323_2-20130528/2467_1 /TAXON_ID=2866 ORGANISM="Crypthecodinium cohnii, Strain Seligo" /NCGR_SAMPLE_ID=MMETSP0323_2 /ASSEMBLY_ACC=CAM_ASM_000346 /LENGTH=192 /DNA_ID=CAMNT_0039662467 /DNA_START=61 /DNA_END=638 /DNA_ORIENTATION=+
MACVMADDEVHTSEEANDVYWGSSALADDAGKFRGHDLTYAKRNLDGMYECESPTPQNAYNKKKEAIRADRAVQIEKVSVSSRRSGSPTWQTAASSPAKRLVNVSLNSGDVRNSGLARGSWTGWPLTFLGQSASVEQGSSDHELPGMLLCGALGTGPEEVVEVEGDPVVVGLDHVLARARSTISEVEKAACS